MNLQGTDIISVDQFSISELKLIFDVAREMEIYAGRKKRTKVLEGAILGNLFFEPSTRSRISFGAAFNLLGGHVRDTTGIQFSSMVKGESLYDTSRVVASYVDIIVIRHPIEGSAKKFAAATDIPVINGGDGPGEHPTQALLDLYTIIKEKDIGLDQLSGLKIAIVGDLKYGRTAHSLTKLLSMFGGIEFVLISPEELRMPQGIIERASAGNNSVLETNNFLEGIVGADVIYMTRIQQERFVEEKLIERCIGKFSLNSEIFTQYCKSDATIMHPLPRDERKNANELDVDLSRHQNLAIFRQAENGIPVRMALFALLLGVEKEVHENVCEVGWYAPRL